MSKLWIENIPNLPNVQYTDEDLATTHTDESANIEAWDLYGLEVLQYMHVRRSIVPLIISKAGVDFSTWANLTPEEKAIAINWIIAPYTLRVPTVTNETDKENWTNLIRFTRGISEKCEGGRPFVIELMRERAADNLRTETWAKEVAENFYFDTIEHITAYEFANTRNLIQWLTNEIGSPYENAGFAQTSYYTTELKDDLTGIYSGFY